MAVVIDAGHFDGELGKETPFYELLGRKIQEEEFTYPTMLELEKQLIYNKIEVDVTNRDVKNKMTVDQRIAFANKKKYDLFLSIHANASAAYEWNLIKGYETWCATKGFNGERLAKIIQAELAKVLATPNRGVKYCDINANPIGVVKRTNAPAALVEALFMTNMEEADRMLDPYWHKVYATALCKAICSFLGVTYKTPVVVKPIPSGNEAAILKLTEAKKNIDDIIKLLV